MLASPMAVGGPQQQMAGGPQMANGHHGHQNQQTALSVLQPEQQMNNGEFMYLQSDI